MFHKFDVISNYLDKNISLLDLLTVLLNKMLVGWNIKIKLHELQKHKICTLTLIKLNI